MRSEIFILLILDCLFVHGINLRCVLIHGAGEKPTQDEIYTIRTKTEFNEYLPSSLKK